MTSMGGTQLQTEPLPWAHQMVRMGARACVVSQLTELPAPTIRKLWISIHGVSSPSGQQPNDVLWYLRNATRRYHSALIVLLWDRARSTLPDYAAMTHAYYHYARLTASRDHQSGWVPIPGEDPAYRPSERDYEVPFSRAHYLCQIYTDARLTTGRRMCSLVMRRCTKCKAVYMAADTEGGAHHCPLCA